MTVYPVRTQNPDPDGHDYAGIHVMALEATVAQLSVIHVVIPGLQVLWGPYALWTVIRKSLSDGQWPLEDRAVTVLGRPCILRWTMTAAYPAAGLLGDTQEDL